MASKKKGMNEDAIDWSGTLFGEVGLVHESDDVKQAQKTTKVFEPERSEKEQKRAKTTRRTKAVPVADEGSAEPLFGLTLEIEKDVVPEEAPQASEESQAEPVIEPAVLEEVASEPESGDEHEFDSEAGQEVGQALEAEDVAADVEEDEEGAAGVPAVMMGAMTGEVEEDGALTLARYASKAYLEYAMSVVKSRALPEVSDGQKPVQRRILIDMDRMGLKHDKGAVKSARVVGDVLGKYHPHGDQSVYDAMVRMAQDFSLRYPLVAGEGNFGSRDGDKQAAMRYTEARLMPIAELLLEEVDLGAVDFIPNYDGNFTEPVELPAKLPFVLLNGASGIAVGMATEIPPHNLNEVAAACELLIENPEATLDDVLKVMPAPDFPCGGQIISTRSEIRSIYRTGRGKLRVRARWHFEELARGQWQLVVDELPPAASSRMILDRIEQITNPKIKKGKKTLSAAQLHDKSAMLAVLERVRDESGKDVPVRLVFEPKSARVDRDEFVRTLLAQTDLESNAPVNLVMIGIDKKPAQKNLLDIIREWIAFRVETVRRRSAARLEKVLDRIHVLEGRQLVLINIDRVIEIIRTSDEPKPALMTEFGLSDRQAEDILEIRLRQLARLAALAIQKELDELGRERQTLERLLAYEGVLRRQVANEIRAAARKFGDARRTLVEAASAVAPAEKKVLDEPVTVVISEKGFLRSRTGHGHDCRLMSFKPGDGFLKQIECRSVDTLTVFDNMGRVYAVPVAALPGGRGDGSPLSAFIDMERGASPLYYFICRPDQTVIFATTDGYGVACEGRHLETKVRTGRAFVKLNDGESICGMALVEPGWPLLGCITRKKRFIVFPADEIRRVASGGKGVALLELDSDDRLTHIGMLDERGVRFFGIGRGGVHRDLAYGRRAMPGLITRRGRRGKILPVRFEVQGMEAIPKDAAEVESSVDVEDAILNLTVTNGE